MTVTRATASRTSTPDTETITEAYLYLLSRALVIRQERHDLAQKGVAYNAITYNPLGSADFVNPNFDVAYLEAWIAVDERTPALLEIPGITGRYYTAQILDEWGEVIANVNDRTFPSRPSGAFALVAPGSQATLPPGVGVIALHSRKAKLLARVELKTDPAAAVALQKQFTLKSLGQPAIAPPPALNDFDNKSLMGPDIFDNLESMLSSALDVAPNAAEMQEKARFVAAYVASSAAARDEVGTLLREHVVPEFQEYVFSKSVPPRNNWVGAGQTGNYGTNYRMRTVVNYAGIWGNASSEVIYFATTRDAAGEPLDGSRNYELHFAADSLPSSVVNGYWSVILVGVPDYRVVPNALERYNLNSYSALATEPDGSLKIGIGPAAAGVPESNWLPSPSGKPFSLTFRTYVPKNIVKKAWAPPPVTQKG